MLRKLSGWLFCLIALSLGAPLLRLLATPRVLAPAPDLVYLDQLLATLIACAGLSGLLIACLLRLPARAFTAILLLLPAGALCIWRLTHPALEPSSPTPEQFRLVLAGLTGYALLLAGIGWLARREGGVRTALRCLGLLLLLPWGLGLFYLMRLYY
ncbi:hypothetical protein H681_22645 [Pseudomonas sp. ATCC 13867]|uniref:hypothetical protein n=1 Tax=Pseudomonas sp. ATCC 13867 TaxID=1294143 RepID=UPI0002C4F378|nr:hypothetical protein [Pseudomonas sp. ATCC 13867]AGI26396.1 hypothetical protein H681_22645 [Pseudomonas sp. ATCC 13867]RFQ25223.1 hypothetical protein D0N87_21285 [Pseudomonas sp. ATCC 13867]